MSRPSELNLTPPTSAMRNTVGREKEKTSKNPDRPASYAVLREYCDKHYHQLLPIIAEKVHNEKVQQEKLKEHIYKPGTNQCLLQDTARQIWEIKEEGMEMCSICWEVEEEVCPHTQKAATRVPVHEERSRSQKSRMPNNVKTYDESDDLEDHLKIFQASTKVVRWAMPTWCHMFNFTLTESARVWFDDLPPESIDSYDDLKKAYLANYLQQKKCIKDPVKTHHIKQREGESTKDFMQRNKAESMHVKGAPECMRISRFMHGITNPELIKRLHDNIPKSVDEMMRVTTAFLWGEVAASNQAQKKAPPT
nr:reverse transcriptase domain-containing protein [Tanacetum cinerariifolium]